MTVSGCPMLLGTGEGQAHSEAAALVLERYSKFDKAALTQSSTNLQPAHPNFLRQLVPQVAFGRFVVPVLPECPLARAFVSQ